MIYLDANATTPLHPRVRAAMEPLLGEVFANPSSLHPPGQAARGLLEQARRQVASLLGCRPPEVVFTSGGTEANVLALTGVIGAAPAGKRRLVTSDVEHPSVAATARWLAERGACELVVLGVDGDGVVREDELAAALAGGATLVSVQAANHETGVLQPLAAIARQCRSAGALLHVDAVQAPGKSACRVAELGGADLVSLSGHKVHGPKGAGALYVRKGVRLEPLLHGGGQEQGVRPGTENILGLVGLGAACELAERELLPRVAEVAALRDQLEQGLLAAVPGARINGAGAARGAGTCSVTFPGMAGASLMIALGAAGIACSMGSACSAGDVKPSAVLLAMGIPEAAARSTLRFSLSGSTTAAEVERAVEVIPGVAARMRALASGRRPAG